MMRPCEGHPQLWHDLSVQLSKERGFVVIASNVQALKRPALLQDFKAKRFWRASLLQSHFGDSIIEVSFCYEFRHH